VPVALDCMQRKCSHLKAFMSSCLGEARQACWRLWFKRASVDSVVLLQEKLDKAVETVRKAVPDAQLTVMLVDLGSFESVR